MLQVLYPPKKDVSNCSCIYFLKRDCTDFQPASYGSSPGVHAHEWYETSVILPYVKILLCF